MTWLRQSLCLTSLAALAVLFVACGPKPLADLTTPKVFEAGGLKFSYPGDWELSESEATHKKGAKLQVVTVRAPTTGAFVTIQAFDHVMKLDLKTWADRFVEGYAKRFVGVPEEFVPGTRTDVKTTLLGESRDGLRQAFEVIAGEARQQHLVDLYVVEAPSATLTVLIQVSQADWERGQDAFELVLDSLESTRTAPIDEPAPEPKTIEIVVPEGPDGEPDWGALKSPKDKGPTGDTESPSGTDEPKPPAPSAPAGP